MVTPERIHEYVGSIHIHSDYSDGLRPIPEIAGLAADCGLDFLLFADHMTLEPIADGMQRWFGPVLSVVGYEINDTANKNHYLAFNLNETLPENLTAREYVAAVRARGGMGFIAHPDEKRESFPQFPPYPWTDWHAEGYDGIEIWNHSSEWLEKLTNANKYFHILHPLKHLRGPEPETLERWDRLNRDRCVPGIGGTDAHAYPYRLGPVTIFVFRYKVLFRGIRTHITLAERLPNDADRASGMVLDALRKGRCFISNRRWGDARGFTFLANAAGRTFQSGDLVEAKTADMLAVVPHKAHIALLRDGRTVAEARGTTLEHRTEAPGAYRIEVRRKGKPWIYSNHIRLRG